MPDVLLRVGETTPTDIRLADPTQATVPLAASTTFAVLAVTAALTVTANFESASGFRLGTDATLTVGGPLLADAAIAISSEAGLTVQHPLAAAASFAIATAGGPITMAADLAAAPAFAISVASYPRAVLAERPIAYWRLNEASGNALDATGNGHTGVVSGGVTRNQAGPLADGDPAMAFDGSTGKIVNGSLNLPAAWTVEAWINTPASGPGAVGQEAYFSTRDGASSGGGYFGISGSRMFNYMDGASPGPSYGGSAVIADGQWHHLVTTSDGTTMRGYVDGVLDASEAKTHTPGTGATANIAWEASTGNFYSGLIDELAVYPSALTADQIAGHYALRRGAMLSIGNALLLSAQATIAVSSVGQLSGLAAQLAAAAGVRFSTTGAVGIGGPSATSAIVSINGVDATGRARPKSMTIADVINEAPNACDFLIDGTPPVVGADVKVGLQNLLTENLLFGGTIRSVNQRYDLTKEFPVWQVSCQDYSYLLNRRKVFGAWIDVSATTVATTILTKYTAGFSGAKIAAGLPAITVTFTGVDVMNAFTEIATLIGGYTFVDYAKVVHLFITEAGTAPDAIDGTHDSLLNLPPVNVATDLSQVRTRVFVKGGGSSIASTSGFTIPAGAAIIPMTDATPFSSGQVIDANGQILNYTGVHAGNVASVVTGNVPAPDAFPTATLASQAGALSGTYRWKVAFANANGETPPGPVSNTITVPDRAAPTGSLGIGATSTVGPLVGGYGYRVSFVTALGETLPGPPVSRLALAFLGPASALSASNAPAPGNLVVGRVYRYVCTFVTPFGETQAGPSTTYVPSALAQGGWSSPSTVPFGGLSSGPYFYGVSIVTALGESSPINAASAGGGFITSPPSGAVLWSGGQDGNGRMAPQKTYVWAVTAYSDIYGETGLGTQSSLFLGGTLPARLLMNLPGGGAPALPQNADGMRIYRAYSGGNPFQLIADFRRGSIPVQFWDSVAQEEAGGLWPVQAMRAGVGVSLLITFSNEPGVVARRIYRTKAGGSEYFFVGELQHNSNAFFVDYALDAQLTQRNPAVQTTGRQARVSLPVSSRLGVTGRRLYRTKADGSTYYLVAEISDNQTTSIDDNATDASLIGATLAGQSTGGGDQHLLTSIPIGPSGTLARKIYRTTGAGGTDYRFLTQISDNVTTSFLDAIADANLGETAPLANTAGASAVLLSQIPIGGLGVTQRILYRTVAGGSDYRYVATINDNTSTTFVDDKADSALGRLPLEKSTIGALAGDTSLLLESTAGWPTAGWLEADSQIINWTSIGGNTLFGIPSLVPASISRGGTTAFGSTAGAHGFADGQRVVILGTDQPEYAGTHQVTVTGSTTFTYPLTFTGTPPATPATGAKIRVSAPGAITGAIAGGTSVVTRPHLSGVSGVAAPMKTGGQLSLWVTCNSAAGQAVLAAAEGGDGIHEHIVTDGSLDSVADCVDRGNAELALFQYARVTVSYTTFDRKTRSGVPVHVALPAPQNVTGDFMISEVRITSIDTMEKTPPRYAVTATNSRYSLADLLRHVVIE